MKTVLIILGTMLLAGKMNGQATPDLELEKLKWKEQYNQYERGALKSTEEATQNIEHQVNELKETIKQGQEPAFQNDNDILSNAKDVLNKPYQSSDGAPTQFDPVKENLDRFTKSPCYGELGFIPGRDNEQLYRDCESRKGSFGRGSGSFGSSLLYAVAGLGGIFLFLFIINHFQKRGGK